MELDDLKDIWKKQGFQPKDEAQLVIMLKGKSISIITRLKRNVWLELIFTFLGGLALLIYALTLPEGSLKWTSISILILFAIYSFYYLKKLQLLNGFDPGNDIKANLQRLILNLKTYLKFYKRSYSILYPVYFLLALLFGGIEQGATAFFHRLARPDVIATLLLGASLFFICSTWLTTWYLKKLYGNHLQKLESLLKDLYGNEKVAGE
ncbi:MAG: hypothetical protein ABIR06_17350 [Cyclobacteriaceae bacterium]